MPSPSAIILIGIPASGKSTFCRTYLFDTHVRINLDQLKSRYREKLLLDACLAGGQSFVVDNTNATRKGRAYYIGMAKGAGFRVVGYYFSSRVSESLQRNRLREGKSRIPDQAVLGISGRLELPGRSEGFDELWFVRMDGTGGFAVDHWRDAP